MNGGVRLELVAIAALLMQACGSAHDPAPVAEPPEAAASSVADAASADAAVSAAAEDAGRGTSGGDAAADRNATNDALRTGGDAAAALPGVECKVARFCEDFEVYARGSAPGKPWTASISGGGKISIDATKAFSGKQSLHITTPGGSFNGGMLTQRTPALPLPGNDLYGRMMVYFETRPGPAVHFTLFGAYGSLPADGGTAGYTMGGTGKGLPLFNYTKGDFTRNERTMPWPVGRWACAQWQFDGSAAPDGTTRDELRFWLDGSPRTDLTIIKTTSAGAWRAPAFDRMRLGFENYQPTDAAIEVWIDDFAIDSKPVACP
jgi:hypothetical protein